MDKIGDRLKEIRGTMSQKDAAKLIGMKQQAWALYEKGQSSPGAKLIQKICCTFHVSSDWLLGLPTAGGGHTVTAGTSAAVNIGSGSATVGGDCSKCQLMADHIRQITGR